MGSHSLFQDATHHSHCCPGAEPTVYPQGGKVITFTLVDASGRATYTQPVWAQWNYDVAGLPG